MLGAITALLGCQLLGEIVSRLAGLPIPGPVLGMVLLFLVLVVRGSVPAPLGETARGLLGHLSLLFVPAGTGVMLHFARIRAEWLPILASIVLSTVLTLAVTALVFRLMSRLIEPQDREGAEP